MSGIRNLLSVAQTQALFANQPKPSKYRAVRTTVNGLTFDSKGEAARWEELQIAEAAGHISGLSRQVRYSLDVNGVHICDYKADFVYVLDKVTIVEDYKGYRTQAYAIKRRLMFALYGIVILETGRKEKR